KKKLLISLSISVLISASVQAEQIDDYNKKLLQSSTTHQIDSDFADALKAQRNSESFREAQMFGQELLKKQFDQKSDLIPQLPKDDKLYFEILVSESMGDDTLRTLMERYAGQDNVSFIIRGFTDKERTFTDVIKRMQRLVVNIEPQPYIKLDPRPFEDMDINEVPYMYAKKNDHFIAGVYGLTNPSWLKEKIEQGQKGELGKWGNTVSISEKSITDIIAERIEKLDKDKIIQGAKDAYWTKKVFVELPMATKNITRIFKPEILITNDIVSSEGVIVAKAGTKINLLEIKPFFKKIVVFDATDPRQVELVKNIHKEENQATTYVTTKVKREQKWKAIKNVESEIGYSVYLLNSDLIKAFNLKSIPSIVTADNSNHVFNIQEFDVRTSQ
ncbi:TPA: TrbC family F-type conjugative pilus assembly protein, partial [Photobacterium damselae]